MPQFLDVSALWWLAAALPAITALYFLRLRRQERIVSSTLLWKRSVYDLRVNAPIQMIRRNLLLLLQLLVATLIIVALARPFTKLMRAQGRRAALIIDCSASMATKDEGDKSRLAAAKEEALKLIEHLGVRGAGANENDELCVIAAADRPVPVCELTADKNKLRKAVASIQLKQSTTDMAAALEMAIAVTGVGRTVRRLEQGGEVSSAAPPEDPKNDEQVGMEDKRQRTKATVIILSDGAFPPLPAKLGDRLKGEVDESEDEASVGAGSRFIRLGKDESDNLAIVAVDLRTDPLGITGRQLFVRVENMSSKEQTTTLTARLNGEFLDSKEVTVPARAENRSGTGQVLRTPGNTGVVLDVPDEDSGALNLQIKTQDAFAVDNQVQAMIYPPEPIRALLVTEKNYYLQQALQADHRNLVYDVMAPADYPAKDTPKNKKGQVYEIIIFDRFAPPTVPPGASFFIDAVPPLPGIKEDEEHSPLYTPSVVDWKRTHPLMRNLSLLNHLFIYECRRLVFTGAWARIMDGQGLYAESLEALRDDTVLATAPEFEAPLLGCLITEDRRVAVLAFNVLKTERWILRVSFPLFIKNVTHWLARPGGLQRAVLYRTGETLRMRFDKEVTGVTVTTPSGNKRTPPLAGKQGAYFSDTYETGLYHVNAPGEPERVYAVNLLSSRESDNAARDSILLGDETLTAAKGPAKRNSDLWPYFILGALLFLLVEWYIYNRRILG